MKHEGDLAAAADAAVDIIAVLQAIAAELEASRHCLEQLGLMLCRDPKLAQTHSPTLQALDELGQRQSCLAEVLRAADLRGAIAHIPLDALRERLVGHLEARPEV